MSATRHALGLGLAFALAGACTIDYDAYSVGGAAPDGSAAVAGATGAAGNSAGASGSAAAAAGAAGIGTAGVGGSAAVAGVGGEAAAAGFDGGTDATDAPSDGPRTDGDAGADADAGDAAPDGGCVLPTKQCGAVCVPNDDPAFGCAVPPCDPCALAHATAMCAGPNCVIAMCDPNFEDCNATDFDGCEVDVRIDPANCNGCTLACSLANATAGCAGAACTIVACTAGFANCDGQVVTGCETDTQTDPADCGVCNNACPAGWTCQGGQCSSCPNGSGDCDGMPANGCETDTSSTPGHCGSCSAACSGTNVTTPACLSGQCLFTCDAGFADCNGPQPGSIDDGCEADLASSALHCGACGDACSAANNGSRSCSNGRCSYGCNMGFADCNGPQPGSVDDGCETNIASHPGNCGACNVQCDDTNGLASCSGGACGILCNPGFASCDGALANGCETTLASNVAHCGSCGAPCSNANNSSRSCTGGNCSYACSAGFADCNGPEPGASDDGCETNVTGDPTNCSACGVVCDATNGAPTCVGGVCGIACSAGFGNCDMVAGNGCETTLAGDEAHCGACAAPCSTVNNSARSCAAGACTYTCNAGFADCNGPDPGVTDDGCETNTSTDPFNCGGCGIPCVVGEECQGGSCVACAAGFGDCDVNPGNGCETDVTATTAHCGSCGGACSAANNSARTCTAGACTYTCTGAFEDCNGPQPGAVDDGCETDTNNDEGSCGTCGDLCSSANGTATCAGGNCSIACTVGFGNCDLDARSNGCEVVLSTDEAHCGSCGGACSPSNNTARTCSGGTCSYTCIGGFEDCNGPDPGATDDGCEINTLTDPNNCGGCGSGCNSTNGTATCSGGNCGIACDLGFANCDGLLTNGCEVNLANDEAHCGSCNGACSTTNNSARTCTGGQCTYTCTGTSDDCNGPEPGATDDGCEVNIASDASHCGGCGDACSTANGSPSCSVGACSIACDPGFSDCNMNARTDGCEINLLTTVAHCGSCGGACSNANNSARTCSGGTCSYTCNGTFADCNGPDPGASDDGCEAQTATDEAHCGSCGGACSTSNNSAQNCASGLCTYTCNGGFSDCNGTDPGASDDGCEAELATDENNCNACGTVCTTTCGSNNCIVGTCTPVCTAACGNCDGNAQNGCETSTATNVAHCGACGRSCSTSSVASRACSGGVCTSSCDLGFGNCGMPIAPLSDDGCERDVRSDDSSCGGCGNSCSLQGSASSDFECDQGGATQEYCGCSSAAECAGSGVTSGATCNTGSGTCACNATSCGLGQWCINNPAVCSCNGGAACSPGQTCCLTPAGCRNLLTDATNCGACGRACPPGFACSGGACRCDASADCNAGGGGTCNVGNGLCTCSGTCSVGERCQPGGTCG